MTLSEAALIAAVVGTEFFRGGCDRGHS
jgi:hypothetical protein